MDIKHILNSLDNNNPANSAQNALNIQVENIPNSLIVELKNRLEKINNVLLIGLSEHINPKIDSNKIISVLKYKCKHKFSKIL